MFATICCLFFAFTSITAQKSSLEKKFLVKSKLILFPINSNGKKYNLDFNAGDFKTYFDLRLASHADSTDYWVFMDVSKFQGQLVNIGAENNIGIKYLEIHELNAIW